MKTFYIVYKCYENDFSFEIESVTLTAKNKTRAIKQLMNSLKDEEYTDYEIMDIVEKNDASD